MDSWLLLLLLVLVLGAAALVAARRRPRDPLGLSEKDREDLDEAAHRVLAEHFATRHAALDQQLRLIVARGVPPRAITPSGQPGRWLLRFADGSEVPVTSSRPGDAGQLNLYLHSRSPVGLTECAFRHGGLVLTFEAGGRRLELLAVTDG